jgi:DNA-binding LytR/AlgR family response regulator
MRLLIVDDEPAARSRLAALVEEIDPAIEIVGEAPDGVAALELARTRMPEVILLDIAMPEVDGLDVARHLPDPRPLIIFQTAYSEYALEAFDEQALDFVVKPVRKERLAQALERARGRLTTLERAGLWSAGSLEQVGAALGYQRAHAARLLVRHGPGHRLLPLNDVLRFAAADGLIHAHTRDGAPVTDYTLGELETRLAAGFVRVSRADLVNLAHIVRIVSNGDGSATLTLGDGSTVHVSRRRAAEVRGVLDGRS